MRTILARLVTLLRRKKEVVDEYPLLTPDPYLEDLR